MGTVVKTKNIGYVQNGTTYSIDVELIENLNQNLIGGVKVALTIPTGVAYQSSVLPQGVYVALDGEWTVGTVLPGQSIKGTFTFLVTDASQVPFEHVFELSAESGCNACFSDTTLEVTVTGVSCSEIQDCLSNLPAYDDNAAALAAGLGDGELYQTTGSGAAPLNAEGIVMVVKVPPSSSAPPPSSSQQPASSSVVGSSSGPPPSSSAP